MYTLHMRTESLDAVYTGWISVAYIHLVAIVE
jgi:hypothetical protein